MELQKTVSRNTLQDIQRSLSCTDEYVKAVGDTIKDMRCVLSCTDARLKNVTDTVKHLQTRMDFLEQDMSVVLRIGKEMTELKEDIDIPYQPMKKQQTLFVDKPSEKKNKDTCYLLRE